MRVRSFALVAALAVPTAVSATQAPQRHDVFARSSLITESAIRSLYRHYRSVMEL